MGLFKQILLAVRSLWFKGSDREGNTSHRFTPNEVEDAYKTVHKAYNSPEDQDYISNTRKNTKIHRMRD